MWVQSLGQEDPLEEKMATHSSIFAWEITWTEEPGGLQPTGSQRVGHNLATKQQQNSAQLKPLRARPSLLRNLQWHLQKVISCQSSSCNFLSLLCLPEAEAVSQMWGLRMWLTEKQIPQKQLCLSWPQRPSPGSSSWWALSVTCCCCSIAKLSLTLCDPVDYSMAEFLVPHYLPEFAQGHVLWISDPIQPSHPDEIIQKEPGIFRSVF